MEIKILNSLKEFNFTAAQKIARQLKVKPQSTLGLATGSTPMGLYHQLARMYQNGDIDFNNASTFNLDEYIGIPKTHPQSYHMFMEEHLFSRINIKRENIHIPDGEAPDPIEECQNYENSIKMAGGIDLQILGIGHNGHIGFNEPGTPFESLTHVVDLDWRTIKANSRFFGSIDQVPRQAITMGIKTIMKAREILLLAIGEDKAQIMFDALLGPVTTEVPASILQLHPNLTVILDQGAASLLQKHGLRNVC